MRFINFNIDWSFFEARPKIHISFPGRQPISKRVSGTSSVTKSLTIALSPFLSLSRVIKI